MQAMKKKLHEMGATAKVEPEVGEKVDKDVVKLKTSVAPNFHEAKTKKMDEKENANQVLEPNIDVISNDYGAVLPYPCFTAGNLPGKNLL